MYNNSSSLKGKFLLVFAFLALAFNLRSHLTSVPSVIGDIQKTFLLNDSAAGLLTSIPVLCFAFLSPAGSFILSKMSMIRGTLLTLCGIGIGVILRSVGPVETTFTGTIILGFSLTIGNILTLMIIAEYFSEMKNFMTGLYVSAMSISSMLTSAATAPIAEKTGWRFSLSVWFALVLIALALWLLLSFRIKNEKNNVGKENIKMKEPVTSHFPIWKSFPAYLLALSFACHTSLFFGITAWLPSYLSSVLPMNPSQAGAAASLFQISGLLGCFGIPALAAYAQFSRRDQFLCVSFAWLILPLGLLFFPHWWILWCLFGGVGAGGGFTVVFGLVMDRADNLDENRKMSAFVQGIGYAFAAFSPVLLGMLKEQSGSWSPGLSVLSIIALVMMISGTWTCGFHEKESLEYSC